MALAPRRSPRRARVAPGDAFVDAGGLEECLPTVRGAPDHGDAWSRPWRQRRPGTRGRRAAPTFTPDPPLSTRRGRRAGRRLPAGRRPRATASSGPRTPCSDLSPDARLEHPPAPRPGCTRRRPRAAGHLARRRPRSTGPWPAPPGCAGHLRPGRRHRASARSLLDCRTCPVHDGTDRLTLDLECAGQPRASPCGATSAASRPTRPTAASASSRCSAASSTWPTPARRRRGRRARRRRGHLAAHDLRDRRP